MSLASFEEDLIREIREDFLEDLKEKISEMNKNAVEVEKQGFKEPLLKEIFRYSHNIKGSAGTLGLSDMSMVAHRIEDILAFLTPDGEKNPLYLAEIFRLLDFMEEQRGLYQKEVSFNAIHKKTLTALQVKRKQKLNIILLESSKSFKNILRTSLQKEGVEVFVAQNSLEALNRSLIEPVDLLITSQEHPVLDGLSLILMLKANPLKANLYTILLTSDKILSPVPDKIVAKDKEFLQKILEVIKDLEYR